MNQETETHAIRLSSAQIMLQEQTLNGANSNTLYQENPETNGLQRSILSTPGSLAIALRKLICDLKYYEEECGSIWTELNARTDSDAIERRARVEEMMRTLYNFIDVLKRFDISEESPDHLYWKLVIEVSSHSHVQHTLEQLLFFIQLNNGGEKLCHDELDPYSGKFMLMCFSEQSVLLHYLVSIVESMRK